MDGGTGTGKQEPGNEGGEISKTEEDNNVTDSEEDDTNLAAVIIPIILIILILASIGFLSYYFYKKDPVRFKNRFCRCCKRR